MIRKKDKKQENSENQKIKVEKNMPLNTENLKKILGDSGDVTFKDIYINGNEKLKVTMLYLDGMVDSSMINNDILKPLIQEKRISQDKDYKEIIDLMQHGLVYAAKHEKREDINECLNDVITGSVAIVFDKENTAVTFEVKGFDKRGISEPTSENVRKGAKDTFVETLRVNTATVRRRLKTPNLRISETIVGRQSQTTVSIVYIEGLTNPDIVEEVRKALDNIDITKALSPGEIEEYIISNRKTPFPMIAFTERPDRFCSNINEGRVGLIIDGVPIAYMIPATIVQLMQAPEDYSQNYTAASFIRFLRYILAFLSVYLPGFYISITSFQQEMIPTELALSIVAAKEGVPFPVFFEIVLLLIAFEILIEAGLRLPQNVGQAVSILGTLVVGQAAVEAAFVSPAVVIIIAVTGISAFSIPSQDLANALRLWRFIFVIASAFAGLLGLTFATMALIYQMASLESYGVPFLSPFVHMDSKQLYDTIFRFPLYMNKNRPKELKPLNKRKQR